MIWEIFPQQIACLFFLHAVLQGCLHSSSSWHSASQATGTSSLPQTHTASPSSSYLQVTFCRREPPK